MNRFKHVFRISALILPSLLAWMVALYNPHRDELTRMVSQVLGPIWLALFCLVVLRAVSLKVAQSKGARIQLVEHLDLLTSSGAMLAWTSAFAIVGAVRLGWASLGAIGMLGTGIFHLVVIYSFIALRNPDLLRGGSIERTLSPETVTEGEDVTEEIQVSNVQIPAGFRLFLAGQVGPRWALSRHVLEARESNGELSLESEIGPAVRGEHDAEPLEVWLEDTFGITKSHPVTVAPAKITVLPKVSGLDKAVTPLLQQGLGPRAGKPTSRIPTEGVMDLREYKDGDDVRRIHWVRSLAAGQLIVRLPDEIPPDRPKVRLVLDTFFPDAFALTCDAPAETLDQMVAVWLGVARALADKGTRVTLVTAAPHAGGVIAKRHEYTTRAIAQALSLGANVAWQGQVPVDQLLTNEATFVVSHGVHVQPPNDPKFKWILVMPADVAFPTWKIPGPGRAPFPLGHPENRWESRKKQVAEITAARADHEKAMRAMTTNVAPPPPGSFFAFQLGNEIRLEPVR